MRANETTARECYESLTERQQDVLRSVASLARFEADFAGANEVAEHIRLATGRAYLEEEVFDTAVELSEERVSIKDEMGGWSTGETEPEEKPLLKVACELVYFYGEEERRTINFYSEIVPEPMMAYLTAASLLVPAHEELLKSLGGPYTHEHLFGTRGVN